jgi:hypothetical protein
MMSLKGKAYLDVANRLLWFVRDQRDFIVRGCATCNYIIRSELVEQDRQAGFAQFKTYVRDVLGNEATMYGSETAKDFGDYAEKASTKSLGRALAMLGYGTAAAPEMDEGDRIVDTPVERKPQPAQPPQQRPFTANPPVIRPAVDEPAATPTADIAPIPAEMAQAARQAAAAAATSEGRPPIPAQRNALNSLSARLGYAVPAKLTYEEAGALIAAWSEDLKQQAVERQKAGAGVAR